MDVDQSSPIYFEMLYATYTNDKWYAEFYRNGQWLGEYNTNTTGRDTKNFNFTIDAGGMTMNFNLTRTEIEPVY